MPDVPDFEKPFVPVTLQDVTSAVTQDNFDDRPDCTRVGTALKETIPG